MRAFGIACRSSDRRFAFAVMQTDGRKDRVRYHAMQIRAFEYCGKGYPLCVYGYKRNFLVLDIGDADIKTCMITVSSIY
jgi:hypothetical protein